MPLKFEIKLSLKLKNEVEQPPLITPDLLHGFFFNLIPKKLAEELHRPSRYKPFCLWSKDIFDPQGPYEELTVTISFLKDEYFPQILAELLEDKKNLFLGPYGVRLQKFEGRLIKNDQYLSYEELRQIKPKPYFYFYFQTPVSFKKGDIDYPLPDPELVFKSLIKKWNYFAPFRVEVDLKKALEEKLCVIFAGIRTHNIRLSLGTGVTGFTGKVIFYGKNLTEEELLWLNILGIFSNFTGVGRKTTMSLGMTKFEARDREEVENHERVSYHK